MKQIKLTKTENPLCKNYFIHYLIKDKTDLLGKYSRIINAYDNINLDINLVEKVIKENYDGLTKEITIEILNISRI